MKKQEGLTLTKEIMFSVGKIFSVVAIGIGSFIVGVNADDVIARLMGVLLVAVGGYLGGFLWEK